MGLSQFLLPLNTVYDSSSGPGRALETQGHPYGSTHSVEDKFALIYDEVCLSQSYGIVRNREINVYHLDI